jgi:hypothetical protein
VVPAPVLLLRLLLALFLLLSDPMAVDRFEFLPLYAVSLV